MLTCLLATLAISNNLVPKITWTVNENRTLIWNGKPYLPVGMECDGSPDSINKLAESGVRDLLLNLPADGSGWKDAFAACEAKGVRYVLTINSLGPVQDAVIVDPAGYRVPDITRKTRVDLLFPESSETLAVLASVRDGSVRWSARFPVVESRFNQVVDPLVEMAHTLLLYPIAKSHEAPDFFEGFDDYRDKLLLAFKSNPPGPNYRGLTDPLGSLGQFPGESSQFVPVSSTYRTEFAAWLEVKYTSIATACKSWGLATNDFKSFVDIASLAPLWSDIRGVQNVWDTRSSRLYLADRKSSMAWRDIRTFLRSTAISRTRDMVSTIKTLTGAPVFANVDDWDNPVKSGQCGLDGVCASTVGGTLNSMIRNVSVAVSTGLQCDKPAWICARGLWPQDGMSLEDTVSELESIGVRGFFVADPKRAAEASKLAESRASDDSSSQWTIKPLYYPLSASGPASPTHLAGGVWWLPTSDAGRRFDFGPGLEGYQDPRSSDTFVVWSTSLPREVQFRVIDPKSIQVLALDGSPVTFKVKKKDIMFVLSTTPMLIKGAGEAPVPSDAFEEAANSMTILLTAFENLANANGGEQYAFGETVRSFENSPGSSYATLRAQLNRLVPKAAPYLWISCSRATKHNFGEVSSSPGSASETVLTVKSRFTPENGVFSAEFPLSPRVPGTHEVWLSARVPKDAWDKMRIQCGERILGPPNPPVSYYGDGFAWFSFGDIELSKGATQFKVMLDGASKSSLALDVIMLAQPGFKPDGNRLPIDWIKSIDIKSKKK